MRPKVMLFTSFAGENYPGTLYALQQWSKPLMNQQAFDIVVGVETGSPRSYRDENGPPTRQLLDVIQHYSCAPVFAYTTECDDVIASLLNSDEPKPFFRGFSYGAYLNRMLLLACALGCDFAVRFDPGTKPPDDLPTHFNRLLAVLASHHADVCSGVYEGRLALRDDLVSEGKRQAYYSLIQEATGVEIHDQITGGAMFAQRLPGIPAIPFPPYGPGQQPTLVWVSDDGFFQLLQGPRCVVLHDSKVPRFALHGRLKPPSEYYRGLAGTVCIQALRRNRWADISALRGLVCKFVDDLNNYLAMPEPNGKLVPADVAPDPFLQAVLDGWVNYEQLTCRWSDIAYRVKQHGCALRLLSSIS